MTVAIRPSHTYNAGTEQARGRGTGGGTRGGGVFSLCMAVVV